ncbi:hypothetical protein LINGRAHAP2_LOCUS15568 [Linum grandiflorum]
MQSLQRGPVPPSTSSPCGHTPGRTGHCTLTEMNYAAAGRGGRNSQLRRHSPPPPAAAADSVPFVRRDFSS